RGQHLLPGGAGSGQVGVDAAAQPGQGGAEVGQARELVLASRLAPGGMVAVLLAPAQVTAGRLDVAVGARADPHLGPGRWQHQGPYALQHPWVAHRFAIGSDVAESAPATQPADAGAVVAAIDQPLGQVLAVEVGGGHRAAPRQAWRATARGGLGWRAAWR